MHKKTLFLVLLSFSIIYAASANEKIQEAAYILATSGDTAQAERLLGLALNFSDVSAREKLNAHLYLAKIAEARNDSVKAVEHYVFLKNNSQNASLAYMAANKEKLLRTSSEKIKMPSEIKINETKIAEQNSNKWNCIAIGEIYIAQLTAYNCPESKTLRLISKKNEAEILNIPFDPITAKVFLASDGIFLYRENSLYFYKLAEDAWRDVWQISSSEIQDIKILWDKIYVLDINGKISRLEKKTGEILLPAAKSDGENFFEPGIGLIGTYQKNGGISVFDTLLAHLWDYQINGNIAESPTVNGDYVVFNLQNGNTEILYTKYYQKLTAPAMVNADSLLAYESGNAKAWYSIAKRENSDSAWQRAVIYGARNEELAPFILAKYAERAGAKWVKHIPVSSNVLYPTIFNDTNWLFVYDAGSQRVFKYSSETGSAAGELLLPKDRRYDIVNVEPPWLMLSSGYSLSQFSLREQKIISFETSAGDKPSSFLRSKDSIYIGFWNGFVLKYYMPKMRLEKSHKISSTPIFLSRGDMGVYSLSQGKITHISHERTDKEINLGIGANSIKFKNGMFVVAFEDGNIQVFSEKEDFKRLVTFSVNAPIVSFELLERNEKTYALVGTANENLLLYEIPSGTRVWTYKSNGSAQMQPVMHGSNIWLDQDGFIAAIDINSGKAVKKLPIFGSGASISIQGNTLYCATPQKLLYAFPL
jgi:hypothetical protein